MALQVGTRLHERYRINQVIAQGGMGAIYKAMDERLAVDVAVKENLAVSDTSTQQFHREATILAGLRHPNLPRVTDHFVIPEQGQYLVMDFVEGMDLKQRINQFGPLPEEEAVLIMAAVCSALEYLHGLNPPIVHRDIKPGNIKITPNGQIFLVDFGLAKVALSGEHTAAGAQGLTPGYAPPEQYGQGTDARSDVYSLGATLYTALTGKSPADALGRATNLTELIPMRQHNPQVSQQVEMVVNKAMAIYANDRFQSATELKEALLSANTAAYRKSMIMDHIRITPTDAATVKSQLPPTPSQPGRGGTLPPQQTPISQPLPLTQAPRPASSSLWKWIILIVLVGGVALLGVLGVGGLLYYLGSSGEKKVSEVTQEATVDVVVIEETEVTETPPELPDNTAIPAETILPAIEATEEVPVAESSPPPSVTPMGGGQGSIAFVSDRQNGIPQIWLMNPDGSEPRQITKLNDGACQPVWSPDGAQIIYISPCKKKATDYEKSGLFIMSADGNDQKPLYSRVGGVFDPAWSKDGTFVAYTSLDNGIPHIYTLNLQEKIEKKISEGSSPDRRPAISPDGKWIAFDTTRIGHEQIWYIASNGSGKAIELSVFSNGRGTRAVWTPDGKTLYYSMGDALPWLASKSFENKSAQEVKVSDTRPVWNVDISPDGYWVVFDTLLEQNDPNIYMMTINGSELTRLTDDKASDWDPAWRPGK